MSVVEPYIKYIYVLLVLAYLLDQYNQFHRFILKSYKSYLNLLLESLLDFSLSTFSLYILFNFNIGAAIMRFFLIMFSIFYFLNGVGSVGLMMYRDNKTIENLNYQIFIGEFIFAKLFAVGLFYLLYKILF